VIIITKTLIISSRNMIKGAHITVTGLVQGVFFRYNTMKKAHELNIKGWVKNLKDGRVEIMAEGEDENLQQFIAWCRKGPQGAYVEGLSIEWKEYTGEFSTFQITY